MSSAFLNNESSGDSKETTKVFQRRAVMNIAYSPSLPAKTVDISKSGISVIVDRPLPEGQQCTVTVDTILDNEPIRVAFTCKVRSNVLAGMRGFRIGLQFADLGPDALAAIDQIMLA
jgi:c-di-GMP-binding flagellar brake protein YcgR